MALNHVTVTVRCVLGILDLHEDLMEDSQDCLCVPIWHLSPIVPMFISIVFPKMVPLSSINRTAQLVEYCQKTETEQGGK